MHTAMQGRSEEDEVHKLLNDRVTGREESKVESTGNVAGRRKQRLKEKYAAADLPQHYRGYEALLEEDSVPVPPIPSGRLHFLACNCMYIAYSVSY